MTLFLLMTSLMLLQTLRLNVNVGISDAWMAASIFMLGTQSISVLAILPTQVVLTYLIPHNVEASTMALVSGTFIWAFEVGAKISSSLYCAIFGVDDDHMENYPLVLKAKLPIIVAVMIFTLILPNNASIYGLAARFREQHNHDQQDKRNKKYESLRHQNRGHQDEEAETLLEQVEAGSEELQSSFSKFTPAG